jgi:hypothetical protein
MHLLLSASEQGPGRFTLVTFGIGYLITAIMIARNRYFAGFIVPFAGFVTGMVFFEFSSINVFFLLIELLVSGMSLSLGFQK